MALFEIEPFGTWRDNWHMAQLTALIANVHRGKNQPAFKAGDFMWRDIEDMRKKSTSNFISALEILARPKNG